LRRRKKKIQKGWRERKERASQPQKIAEARRMEDSKIPREGDQGEEGRCILLSSIGYV
jgi:hypothetical protein